MTNAEIIEKMENEVADELFGNMSVEELEYSLKRCEEKISNCTNEYQMYGFMKLKREFERILDKKNGIEKPRENPLPEKARNCEFIVARNEKEADAIYKMLTGLGLSFSILTE